MRGLHYGRQLWSVSCCFVMKIVFILRFISSNKDKRDFCGPMPPHFGNLVVTCTDGSMSTEYSTCFIMYGIP